MPLERVSRSFKDISLSFVTNPATNDTTVLTNERAISRSIRNLLSTSRGEKFFRPDVGSNISDILFENSLEETSLDVIKSEIENTLSNYEPRIEVVSVNISATPDNNSVEIDLIYRIVGISLPTQQLSFVFQPVR
jgi:phage baseplate assembly protein W